MNTQTKEEVDHGQTNAAAWYGSICEMVAALNCDYERLEELSDERADLQSEATDDTNVVIDEARDALRDWDANHGDELESLRLAATLDGHFQQTHADAVRERIQESVLSVEVRSAWYNPGDPDCRDMAPEEFQILLTTGGPALRLCGELDEHCQPTRAVLQFQDWGTPWTDYYTGDMDTLLAFASCFYFGE
jgi:hypothetical protein